MTSSRWPKPISHKGISRQTCHAIGVLVVNWNFCVSILEYLLSSAIGLDMRSVERIINQMGEKTRSDLLLGLVSEKEIGSSTREHIEHFAKCYDICRENRNILVHSLLILEHPSCPGPALYSTKASVEIRERVIPLSADLVHSLCDDTSSLYNYALSIIDAGYIGVDGNPLPMPNKIPLPNKLSVNYQAQAIELVRG